MITNFYEALFCEISTTEMVYKKKAWNFMVITLNRPVPIEEDAKVMKERALWPNVVTSPFLRVLGVGEGTIYSGNGSVVVY